MDTTASLMGDSAGHTSAYGNPLERRNWIPAYCLVFEVVSTIFVGLRLSTRIKKGVGAFGLDDGFVLGGWVFGTAKTVMFIVGALHYGYNGHTSALSNSDIVESAQIGWIGQLLYLLSTNCTKLAVLLFYRRLVQTTLSKPVKWAVWAAMGFTVMYFFSFMIVAITHCKPVEAYWMRFSLQWLATAHPYVCRQNRFSPIFSGALSVLGDAYSLAIPAFILVKLQLPKRQTLGLYLVFAIGISVVAAGIVRTFYIAKMGKSRDTIWYGANTFLAAIAEIHLALICACAPSLRSVFKDFFNDRLLSRGNSSDNSLKLTKQSSNGSTKEVAK